MVTDVAVLITNLLLYLGSLSIWKTNFHTQLMFELLHQYSVIRQKSLIWLFILKLVLE